MSCRLTANESTRNRWVARQLRSLPDGSRILDAGCGQQPYRPLCAHLEYVAQDFGQYDGGGPSEHRRQQNPNFRYGPLDIRSDIWDIPSPPASFDAILCTEVLEHIPYPNETIRELARLLKPNGVLLLTAPVCSIPHFNPFYFYNGFSREFYEHCAQQNGLAVEEVTANGNEFLYVLQEFMRLVFEVPTIFGKAAFAVCAAPSVAFLSVAGKLRKSSTYLCFGYHVRLRKPAAAPGSAVGPAISGRQRDIPVGSVRV